MTATDGPVAHRVDITTVADWTVAQFGAPFRGTLLDWLATPTQVLAETTAGAVYHDDDGDLTALRAAAAWYPDDVWRYVLAAQWTTSGRRRRSRAGPARPVTASVGTSSPPGSPGT